MAVARLSADSVIREALETLQLPSRVSLMSEVGLAASVRRTASFSCPTASGTLVRKTVGVLRDLPGFDDETPQRVAQVVDNLVAYGDLLELPVDQDDGVRRNLFLGSPSYICRAGSNSALVIGIRSEGAPLLSDDLTACIEFAGHARVFRASQEEEVIDDLLGAEGLLPLAPEQWLRAPREANSDEITALYTSRLESQGLPGDVELRIIDPSSSPTYYRGRWRQLKGSDDGYFVGRRPQAFGADLWSFVRADAGRVTKLIDFPIEDPLIPGADEAWRLQAAFDASRGTPQRVRRCPATDASHAMLDFFSPLPSWLQRRLDILGTSRRGSRGALFAYELPTDEVEEELAFLRSRMWLSPESSRSL